MFGRDAVYHVDGGMTSLWAALALPQTRPNSYHGIMEFGMLGTGIPQRSARSSGRRSVRWSASRATAQPVQRDGTRDGGA